MSQNNNDNSLALTAEEDEELKQLFIRMRKRKEDPDSAPPLTRSEMERFQTLMERKKKTANLTGSSNNDNINNNNNNNSGGGGGAGRSVSFSPPPSSSSQENKSSNNKNWSKLSNVFSATTQAKKSLVAPSKMRGAGIKVSEPSMNFLLRLSDVSNAAYLANQHQLYLREKQQQQQHQKKSSSAPPPPPPPDLSKLLVEVDMQNDRQWGIPSRERGIFFFVQLVCILFFTIFVPWNIVRAKNGEVSLWSLQSASSFARRILSSSSQYMTFSSEQDSFLASSSVSDPIPSVTFAVAGNDGVAEIFRTMFDQVSELPSSWVPVGSLVFSVAMGDSATVLCPTTVAPVPTATSSSSSTASTKVTCMPFDISVTTGLSTSDSYRLQGIDDSATTGRTRINIDPVPSGFLAMEGDLLCLGAVCAPASFRQVGWSFPSVNRFPHDPASFLKWRLAVPMNSTAWSYSDSVSASSTSSSASTAGRNQAPGPSTKLYYSTTEAAPAPARLVSTAAEAKDAIRNLVAVPGAYLALALAEFSVFDTASDSLIFFQVGFESEGGAGAFAGKISVTSISLGDDGRSIALRTFALIFSITLLAFAVFAPFARIYLVRSVGNCSGCIFNETMKRRPFKTITFANCISCKEPVLVRGAEPFRCDCCNATQPAAEHHRCWRSAVCDFGWVLCFLSGLCGLLWGGSDGVTLGHIKDYVSTMKSQADQYGVSFLTLRNLSNLINLHQRGFGAVILFLAALNTQRVVWHLFSGNIALAWLNAFRRGSGIFVSLFLLAVLVSTFSSWAVGLPAYRAGPSQGSITESFEPPGIVFSWGQSVIWWVGRFILLCLAAFAIAVVCTASTSSSGANSSSNGIDQAALMTYDPDWQSLKVIWNEFWDWVRKLGGASSASVSAASEEEKEKEEEKQTTAGGMNSSKNNNNNNEKEAPLLPNASMAASAAAGGDASSGGFGFGNKKKNLLGAAGAAACVRQKQQRGQGEEKELKHPVDDVLDIADKEEELSADPLTGAVDKLERAVSNLMVQLPPILEDAVDERVHFTMMQQSRDALLQEFENDRSFAHGEALKRVEEMRQSEWQRQMKTLENLENYDHDDDGGGEEYEDEDDEYADLDINPVSTRNNNNQNKPKAYHQDDFFVYSSSSPEDQQQQREKSMEFTSKKRINNKKVPPPPPPHASSASASKQQPQQKQQQKAPGFLPPQRNRVPLKESSSFVPQQQQQQSASLISPSQKADFNFEKLNARKNQQNDDDVNFAEIDQEEVASLLASQNQQPQHHPRDNDGLLDDDDYDHEDDYQQEQQQQQQQQQGNSWKPPGFEKRKQQQLQAEKERQEREERERREREKKQPKLFGRGTSAPPSSSSNSPSPSSGRGKRNNNNNNVPQPLDASNFMSPRSAQAYKNNHNKQPHQQQQQQQNQKNPEFVEYEDFQQAAQAALRNEELRARGQSVPEMEYLPASSRYRHPEQNQQVYHAPVSHDDNNNNDLLLGAPTSSSSSSSSAPRSSRSQQPSASPSPAFHPKSKNYIAAPYRSQNPSDYIVDHILDEDEVADLLSRDSLHHHNHDDEDDSHYNNNNNNSKKNNNNYPDPEDYPLHQQQNPSSSSTAASGGVPAFGRYSGLPPSQVLHAPREPIGRPFGGQPSALALPTPEPNVFMQPKHY